MAPLQRRLPLNSDGVPIGDLHDTALNYFCEDPESPSRHRDASPPPSRCRAIIGAAAVLWICATVWAMTTNVGMEEPVDVAQMWFIGESDVASVWRAPPPSHAQQQPPAKSWWDSEMMDPDPAVKGSSAKVVCSGCDMEAHVALLKNVTLPAVLAAHATAAASAPSTKRPAAPRGAGWPAGLAPFTQADLQAWQDGLTRMGESDLEWAQRLLLALLGTCAPAAAPGPRSAAPLALALAGRSVVDQQVGRAACSLACALANASASSCGACPECSPASGASGPPGVALAAAHVAFGPGVDEEDMKAFRRYEFVYNKVLASLTPPSPSPKTLRHARRGRSSTSQPYTRSQLKLQTDTLTDNTLALSTTPAAAIRRPSPHPPFAARCPQARGDVARWTEAGTPVPPEACIGPNGETLTLRQIYDVVLRGGGRSAPKRYVEAIVSTKPAARHCAVAGAAGGIALRASGRSDVGLQGSILREFGGGKYAGYLLPVETGDFAFELGWADGRAADAAGDAPFEFQLRVTPKASAPRATTPSTPPPLCTSLLPGPALALNGRWVGDDWAPFRCYLAPVTQPLLRRCAAGAPLHLLLVGREPMRDVFSWLGRALLGADVWGAQLASQQAGGEQGGRQQASSPGGSIEASRSLALTRSCFTSMRLCTSRVNPT